MTTGARDSGARTVVRAPNHLGDLVMALPALAAAGSADVLVASSIAPLLSMATIGGRVLPLTRGAAGTVPAVAALRRGHYTRGVLLTPSFSSAALFAAARIPVRRGTATDRRRLLLTDAIPPATYGGQHRASIYWSLVTDAPPPAAWRPRLVVPDEAAARWHALGIGGAPLVGLFPGGNAPSRRWAPDAFAALAARLARRPMRVVVFGGPSERALTAHVAGNAGVDLGGRTDLPLLAAGLAACRLLVTNDSGPLHVAGAVGTPTVSLWGAGDPRVTGPLGPGQRMIRHPELPCVPCTRNVCPRHGRGTWLPDARTECLALISVDDATMVIDDVQDVFPSDPFGP